jgi:SAM-dependent methyltransferase
MRFFGHFASQKSTTLGQWLTTATVRRQFDFLHPFLGKKQETAILEVGPGHGEFMKIFLDAGYTNYSIIEPDDQLRADCELLPISKAYSNIVPPFPVDSGSMDLIILCDVFEHMNDTAVAVSVLAEARRALVQGGLIFILSPDYVHWKDDFFNCDFSHSNPTTIRRTSQIFENVGFTTVAFDYHYNFLRGWLGFLIGNTIKLATAPFKHLAARNASRIYRLRLCFLRRFLIVGKAV